MRSGFWRCNFIHIHSLSTCRDLFNLKLFFTVQTSPEFRPIQVTTGLGTWHITDTLLRCLTPFRLTLLVACLVGGVDLGVVFVSTCQTFVSSRQCDGDSMWRIEALTHRRLGSVGLSEWVLSALGCGLVGRSPQLGCQIGVCPPRAARSVSPGCVPVGVVMVQFHASTCPCGWHHVLLAYLRFERLVFPLDWMLQLVLGWRFCMIDLQAVLSASFSGPALALWSTVSDMLVSSGIFCVIMLPIRLSKPANIICPSHCQVE